MAAIPAIQVAAATASVPAASATPDANETAQFGDIFAREMNRPTTPAQGEGAAGEESAAVADAGEPAAVPVDPLLLSLQMALAQATQQAVPAPSLQTASGVLPQTTSRAAGDFLPVEAGATALLSGPQAQENAGALSVEAGQATLPQVGKPLPETVVSAANPASFAALLQAKGEGDDGLLREEKPLPAPALVSIGTQHKPLVDSVPGREMAAHVVAEPVGNSRWGEVVAQRVSMMLGRQEQQLQMQLNPPHLGPMEVQLTMGKEQATIVFTSQQASVREALAAATPRLTALLADQGITLTNVQVASDSLNQHNQQQAAQQQASGGHRQRGARDAGLFDLAPADIGVVNLGEIRVPVARSGVSLYV